MSADFGVHDRSAKVLSAKNLIPANLLHKAANPPHQMVFGHSGFVLYGIIIVLDGLK